MSPNATAPHRADGALMSEKEIMPDVMLGDEYGRDITAVELRLLADQEERRGYAGYAALLRAQAHRLEFKAHLPVNDQRRPEGRR